jgi:hypothetical protein
LTRRCAEARRRLDKGTEYATRSDWHDALAEFSVALNVLRLDSLPICPRDPALAPLSVCEHSALAAGLLASRGRVLLERGWALDEATALEFADNALSWHPRCAEVLTSLPVADIV